MKILETFADGTIKRASVMIAGNFGMATVSEMTHLPYSAYTVKVESRSYKVETSHVSADEVESEVALIVKALELLSA